MFGTDRGIICVGIMGLLAAEASRSDRYYSSVYADATSGLALRPKALSSKVPTPKMPLLRLVGVPRVELPLHPCGDSSQQIKQQNVPLPGSLPNIVISGVSNSH